MARFSAARAAFVRISLGLVALSVCLACAGGLFAGDDDEGGEINFPRPVITTIEPCAALPGETIRIRGTNLFGASVNVGGAAAQVLATSTTELTVKISDSALAAAPVASVTTLGGGYNKDFKILTGATVTEREPNDDINGADATDTGGERKGGGSLSSPIDRDHFRIDCLDPASPYKVKVTPAAPLTIYVDGRAVNLDANGEATISSGATGHLVGFTGFVGAYSFELNPQ